jgi:hypothetical protein
MYAHVSKYKNDKIKLKNKNNLLGILLLSREKSKSLANNGKGFGKVGSNFHSLEHTFGSTILTYTAIIFFEHVWSCFNIYLPMLFFTWVTTDKPKLNLTVSFF